MSRISYILNSERYTIREVAQIIGLLVSSFPAVRYGECHYRVIEQDKIEALKITKGNFDKYMQLSTRSIEELNWWLLNLPNSYNLIHPTRVDVSANSDASLTGWGGGGGVLDSCSTGGSWTAVEAQQHINYLELLAAFFTLKSFINHLRNKHVKIMIDNTTAVSVGTNHSEQCNEVTHEIWALCEKHGIWLTAAYIHGKLNILADKESRNKNLDTEWMLNKKYMTEALLSKLCFSPNIDLFSSRLNTQFDTYVSYKPDPYAKHIDAFTISWAYENFYCFPPFSCILRVLRKIIQDKATGILVVPDWPTQSWYPLLLQFLVKPPHRLLPKADILVLPSDRDHKHPLHKNLNILICHDYQE